MFRAIGRFIAEVLRSVLIKVFTLLFFVGIIILMIKYFFGINILTLFQYKNLYM